jgi:hypothetical protein
MDVAEVGATASSAALQTGCRAGVHTRTLPIAFIVLGCGKGSSLTAIAAPFLDEGFQDSRNAS